MCGACVYVCIRVYKCVVCGVQVCGVWHTSVWCVVYMCVYMCVCVCVCVCVHVHVCSEVNVNHRNETIVKLSGENNL